MSLLDCVLDPATGCINCPEIPFVPATPPHVEFSTLAGWNAGANSLSILGGDVHTIYQITSATGGVVCGFKYTRERNTIPELINYGFYFQQVAGLLFASVVELGHTKVPAAEVDNDAHFEIRRVGDQVLYLVDGMLLYRSQTPSVGALLVNACLYISGDSIA